MITLSGVTDGVLQNLSTDLVLSVDPPTASAPSLEEVAGETRCDDLYAEEEAFRKRAEEQQQDVRKEAKEAAGSDDNTVPHIQYSELDVESSPLAACSAMLVRGKLSLPRSFKLRQSQVCPASETELRKPF